MQGWSIYKQGRLDEALNSFFGVLDLKLAGRGEESLDKAQGLSRADRELIEDTFRVASISLENLQGAESIPPFMTTPTRKTYEFRVYEQLGELYIKQERPTDAADTFNAFARKNRFAARAGAVAAGARDRDLREERLRHPGDPRRGRREYVAQSRPHEQLPAGQPPTKLGEKAQPIVKTRLGRARAAVSRSGAEEQEDRAPTRRKRCAGTASTWRRSRAIRRRHRATSCSRSCCSRTTASPKRASNTRRSRTATPRHQKSADAGYAALLGYAELVKKSARRPRNRRCSAHRRQRAALPGDLPGGPAQRRGLADTAEKLYTLNAIDQAGAGRAAGRSSQAASGRRPAQGRLDRDSPTRRSTLNAFAIPARRHSARRSR